MSKLRGLCLYSAAPSEARQACSFGLMARHKTLILIQIYRVRSVSSTAQCSVGKVPVGERLSDVAEYLSLPAAILSQRRKTGNGARYWWHFLPMTRVRGLRATSC